MLQRYATHYVSAKAQAALITKMQDLNMLDENELAAFKRGRNAKSHTHAKDVYKRQLKTFMIILLSLKTFIS